MVGKLLERLMATRTATIFHEHVMFSDRIQQPRKSGQGEMGTRTLSHAYLVQMGVRADNHICRSLLERPVEWENEEHADKVTEDGTPPSDEGLQNNVIRK